MACFLKEAFFQTGGETVLAFRDAAIKGLFDVQGRDSAGVKNKFPLYSEGRNMSLGNEMPLVFVSGLQEEGAGREKEKSETEKKGVSFCDKEGYPGAGYVRFSIMPFHSAGSEEAFFSDNRETDSCSNFSDNKEFGTCLKNGDLKSGDEAVLKEKRPLRVYLIAGEPSGDLLGSRLMRALKKQEDGRVEFFGVGGETMKAEGLSSLFDIKDLAIMGLLEVVPSIPKVLSLMSRTMKDIEEKKPDVVLTIDSWSFSEQIHKRILKRNLAVPHFHYVAPQAWAWKKGRAKKLGALMEHVFALLPYEEAFFAPYGAHLTYVGHPVVEGGASKGEAERFLEKHHINKETFIVCMLPGSRKTEVSALLPVFRQAAILLKEKHPSLQIVIPTVATIADRVEEAVRDWPVPVLVLRGEGERYDAFAAAKGAIAASGTVSLELAMSGTPHLIAYKVSALTAFLMRRFLKVKYVNLINILQNEEIVPELLQERAEPEFIVETFEKIIQNEGVAQRKKMASALKKLGADDLETPSQKAARKLKSLLDERRQEKGPLYEGEALKEGLKKK